MAFREAPLPAFYQSQLNRLLARTHDLAVCAAVQLQILGEAHILQRIPLDVHTREKIGNVLRQIPDCVWSCWIKFTASITELPLSHILGIEKRPVCIFVNRPKHIESIIARIDRAG